MKKIAVILCGSGFKDGSEIRESVAVYWALSQLPIEVKSFSPDAQQMDVVNCLTGKRVDHETRNMLIESARIARGDVQPLQMCDPEIFSAVILPGGFGAAKNLCTFASEGSRGSVRPDLQKILEIIHNKKKPIGAICIAPALLALAFKNKKFELTVGAHSEASQEIEKLGHRHIVCPPEECHVDPLNRIVTTPAYMYDSASLHSIFSGIEKLVKEVGQLI